MASAAFLFLSRQSSLSKSPRRPFFGEHFFRLASPDHNYRARKNLHDESFGGEFFPSFFLENCALVADGSREKEKEGGGGEIRNG